MQMKIEEQFTGNESETVTLNLHRITGPTAREELFTLGLFLINLELSDTIH